QGVGAGLGDDHVDVPAGGGQGADGLLGQPVLFGPAGRVVEGEPPPSRIDEVDGALRAAGLRHGGEGDAVLAVQRADEVALRVAAEEVDVVGAQPEGAGAEGDEVPALSRAGDDARADHVTVGERQRQFGHMNDGVHARAAQHEHVDVCGHTASPIPVLLPIPAAPADSCTDPRTVPRTGSHTGPVPVPLPAPYRFPYRPPGFWAPWRADPSILSDVRAPCRRLWTTARTTAVDNGPDAPPDPAALP